MYKILLIFIISCNTAFAQGNLVFSEPMHFTSYASIFGGQTRICFDTISSPPGHVLKLESHFLAVAKNAGGAFPVLSTAYPAGVVIEATRTIPGKGIILGSHFTPESGNFPMWLSAGTYFLYIHKDAVNIDFESRYSLHGILFSIN